MIAGRLPTKNRRHFQIMKSENRERVLQPAAALTTLNNPESAWTKTTAAPQLLRRTLEVLTDITFSPFFSVMFRGDIFSLLVHGIKFIICLPAIYGGGVSSFNFFVTTLQNREKRSRNFSCRCNCLSRSAE